MTAASPYSVVPVYPPPAPPDIAPVTVAQVRSLITQGSSDKTLLCDAQLDGLAHGGDRLLDCLIQLSAKHHTIHFACPDAIDRFRLKAIVTALKERRPRLRLSLACRTDGPIPSDFVALYDIDAIVHIQWHITGPLPKIRLFKAFSKAGVWNHLVLDGSAAGPESCKSASLQPNIIHSWETVDTVDDSRASDRAYDQVRPLPGRPLWRIVKDPIHRFLLVDRLTKDQLLRLRIDDDGEHLYTVGDTLDYHFLPPDRLPEHRLDEICAMVAAGGTVAATHVRSNLSRAYLIGYVQERGMIVGNSSLKNPRTEYIARVRRQSGLNLAGFVERGYTSVRPEYRGLGIGTTLLEGLTQRAGNRKIFSVIAEDNEATKVIARRNRTRQVATYFSEKTGKPVGIWMPEWMIGDMK